MGATIALCLVSLTGCGAIDSESPRTGATSRPNVVLIVMDTLRADRLHATRNGRPVMPFLSRMANEGTWYAHAIAPCSWTKPTMASVLTGLYPQRHGVIYSARMEDPANPTSDRLAEALTTLPELLRDEGYDTWAFQTNANLTAPLGFAQGFAPEDYLFANGARADQVTDAAIEALPQQESPFFLYAHYMDPHAPYTPAQGMEDALGPMPELPEYDRKLLDDDEQFMAYYNDQVKTALGLQAQHGIPDLSDAGKEAVRHRYDLECLAMDRAIERLVNAIRTAHPNTLFVFLSDHGEEFWERGGMGHGTTLYQEQVHVPLIVVGPRIPARRIIYTVSLLDLLPKLARRLQLDGADLDGAPLGPAAGLRPAFTFSKGPWPALGVDVAGVVDGGHSYLLDRRNDEAGLFSLSADPGETRNMALQWAAIAEKLREQLETHLSAFEADPNQAVHPLDDASLERLKALGYVDSPDTP